MKKAFLFSFGFVFFALQIVHADVAITVYNDNRALVKETRTVTLKKGLQSLEFDEVAAYIDATSVLPKFLTDASKIKVLEQNFDYDLVNTNKLLSKYIGQNIEIERAGDDKRPKITGKLLSSSGGLVVQTDKKIIINPEGEVSFAKMPEGLRLKPTLTWLVQSSVEGKKKMEVSYQTSGIKWNADYILVTDENDEKADITGWVTVNNYSGATYKDAKLKLIAGDVNMVKPAASGNRLKEDGILYSMAKTESEPSFTEKSFFEYHVYELQRKTTVKDNEIKQIEFISANSVPVKKVFTFNGTANDKKVTVNLEFKNSKDNNLGIPLPKGKIRVSKYDGDSMEFVGEDLIDHTAKDAELSIYIGNAFDITGERVQSNYKSASKSVEESYKITVKNSKNKPVNVKIIEPLYRWNQWKVTESSDKYTKKDSRTIEIPVVVPANSEKTVTYTVKYSW